MTTLEKIKDMIDFCDAIGCHRALYESLKAVEAELEALQQRSCDGCKHHITYITSTGNIESCLIFEKDETLCVRKHRWLDRYEPKE